MAHGNVEDFFGGVLRLPPLKQALMSDLLRSRFLTALKAGAQKKYKKQ